MRRLRPSLWLAFITLIALPVSAQVVNEELICPEPDPTLDRYQYLRALSLDLRGRIPTVEEYALLDDEEDVPLELIDEWLASEEFADRVVRQHRALLWMNISNQRILSNNMGLSVTSEGLYFRRGLADNFRGSEDQENENIPCLNVPAVFDKDRGGQRS